MAFEMNGTLMILVLLIIVLGVLGKIYYDNNSATEQFDPEPEMSDNTTPGMHMGHADEWSRRYGRRRRGQGIREKFGVYERFEGGCPAGAPQSIEEGVPMEGQAIDEVVMESDMMENDAMDEIEQEVELVSGPEVPHEMVSEEVDVVGEESPVLEGVINHHELNKNQPHIDPQTGILMDGPGFARDRYVRSKRARRLIPPNYYFIDDGANGEMSIQHNLCSKSCCSDQWPTPFKQKYDPFVCKNKDQFVPSNIFCNNSFQDSGCLCLNKKQAQFLYNRGGNGRESF